jgi:hypothetical protein
MQLGLPVCAIYIEALQAAYCLMAVLMRIFLEDFYRSFDECSKTVVYCKASLITAKPSKVRRDSKEKPVKAAQKSE